MKNVIIVADSAADVRRLESVPFAAAPLKVRTAEKEYVDDENLNVYEMVEDLYKYTGKSTSSCPNPDEWLKAFGDAENVFAVTLTSGISGSYNACETAKALYEAEHPGRRVFVIDSLSAGPGETILVYKLEELIASGMEFDEVCAEIKEYQKKTGLLFMLESLKTFANNGRVSPAVAKITGLLGIRIVGRASREGTLQPTDKCRSQAKSIETIVKNLKASGFEKGKVLIAHCFNEAGAQALKNKIQETFERARVMVYKCNGLCSFYAEKGGLLVGYEAEREVVL